MEREKMPVEPASDKPVITIEYCPKCHWMLRAAYMAQEFLLNVSKKFYGT